LEKDAEWRRGKAAAPSEKETDHGGVEGGRVRGGQKGIEEAQWEGGKELRKEQEGIR